jgi:hypothetical protein
MIGEQGGGGFAIGAGDANHFGIGVPEAKFEFVDDLYAFGFGGNHQGCFIGYARAFDDQIGTQDFFLCVLFLFPSDVVDVEFVLVFGCDFASIRYKYVPVLGNPQNCSTCAAFACAQYDQFLSQRSLINANVAKTNMMVINQKRMVILLSGMFFF